MFVPSAEIEWIKGLHSHLSPVETGSGETMCDCWMESISQCPRAVSANITENIPRGPAQSFPSWGHQSTRASLEEPSVEPMGTVHLPSLFLSLSKVIYIVSEIYPWNVETISNWASFFQKSCRCWYMAQIDLARGDALDVYFLLSPHLIYLHIYFKS